MTPNAQNNPKEPHPKLDKFEYILLALSLNVQDLPLEAKQLEHILPIISSLKTAHEEIIATERQEARTNELAKTCLAGMPELTPRQQDYITKRLAALSNPEQEIKS